MGGNGFGNTTGKAGDGGIGSSRVLEVTDVELEHLSHACEQCLSEAEMMVMLNGDVESGTASII